MFTLGALIFLIYDENHHPQLLVFMLASTLAAAAGAWFFLRSSSVIGRVSSIIGSLIAAAIINGISNATWDWHAYYGYPKPDEAWYKTLGISIVGILFWILLPLWPAIIALIRREKTRQMT